MTSDGCSELCSPQRLTISCFMQKQNTQRTHWGVYTWSHLQSMREKKYKHVKNKFIYHFSGTLEVVYISIPKMGKILFPHLGILYISVLHEYIDF